MGAAAYPPTGFASTRDGVPIAYSVTGEGRPLVFVRGVNSHLEVMWDDPQSRGYFEALARRNRLVRFDARGNGLSGSGELSVDGLIEDLRAVMDELALEDVVLYGQGFGGPAAIAYAAEHPDRVGDLILYCACADGTRLTGLERLADLFRTNPDAAVAWLVYESYPSTENVPSRKVREQARSIHPDQAAAHFALVARIDVSDRLASVRARTLVMHPQQSRAVPVAMGRQLAAAIPGARFVRLPGGAYNPWAEDGPATLRLIAEFQGQEMDDDEPAGSRELATVLFTDIVGSTERLAAVGDRRWVDLLQRHAAVSREHIQRFGGRYVKDTGDGLVATFPSPAAAIRCALAIRAELDPLGISIRAGLHAGEVELAGDDQIHGIAVHVAARVTEVADPGEIYVSRTITDLAAGAEIPFVERGEYELKGVPGRWALFAVRDPGPRTDDGPL